MSSSGELSVITVVALVLGGVAAFVLAVAVATKDPPAARLRSAPASSATARPTAFPQIAPEPTRSTKGAAAGDVEYPVDTSEP